MPLSEDGWIDISVPLTDAMLGWPGDTPLLIERERSIAAGDGVNVTRIACSAHTGTHVDAPLHFVAEAAAVDAAPLSAWIGRARVLDIPDVDSIGPNELAAAEPQAGERILLRTRNSERAWWKERFREDFAALSLDGARYLAGCGVRTFGIDYLSVSRFHDDAEAVHRALLEAGIWLIEGLDLTKLPPGDVDLICLPLRLVGADGAPARAVARPCST